jgi:hypothetical protein
MSDVKSQSKEKHPQTPQQNPQRPDENRQEQGRRQGDESQRQPDMHKNPAEKQGGQQHSEKHQGQKMPQQQKQDRG